VESVGPVGRIYASAYIDPVRGLIVKIELSPSPVATSAEADEVAATLVKFFASYYTGGQ
jgi:hypothetical protein